MHQDLTNTAIKAALSHNWEQAVTANETILQLKEDDLEALSRLAYAFTQIGNIDQAKKIYKKILSIDRYNFIAQKNLEKINALPKNTKNIHIAKQTDLSPTLFLEEPGKTRSISLKNVAPTSTLSKLAIGEKANLNAKKHSIEVRDSDKTYLGALPDDIAFRLLRFLQAGNTYSVYIKNIQKNAVSVFIREEKRSKKLLNQPSFLPANHEFTPAAGSREYKKTEWQEEEEKESKEAQDEFEE